MTKYIVFVVCLMILTWSILGWPEVSGDTCVITRVVDGDTVKARCNGQDTTIRLTLIDSYESKRNSRSYRQAYEQHLTIEEVVNRGKQDTVIAKKELEGKTVILKHNSNNSVDRYGRDLGELYLNGTSVNLKFLDQHPDLYLKY